VQYAETIEIGFMCQTSEVLDKRCVKEPRVEGKMPTVLLRGVKPRRSFGRVITGNHQEA